MNYLDEIMEDVQDAKTMAQADFILAKIAEIDMQIVEVRESHQTQLERLNIWRETRTISLPKQIDYYMPFLRAYMERTGSKTEHLSNGELRLRKQQPLIEIIDEQLLLNSGEFVRTKTTTSIDKAGIRSHIKSTGEVPSGIDFQEQPDKFSYKL